MVAFQFPPYSGSSGIQRTLRFVQHLPSHGWQSVVLSAKPCAYETTSDDLMDVIPPSTIVERAFAVDAARHLAIAGRYPASFARPDRWRSWALAGVRAGMRLIETYQPAAIWSTYPIPTAHVIASRLRERSGLPWIADFRDPMAQDAYPADLVTREQFLQIERNAMDRARFNVFTTPGAAGMYRNRYQDVEADRIRVIENGYDEESFASLDYSQVSAPLNPGAVTILHSGALYPSERDPTQLFAALGSLKAKGLISSRRLQMRFRASSQDDLLKALAESNGVGDLLQLAPSMPYRSALAEMLKADVLLVLQSAGCNEQIPAKLYEYLRSDRPIVGLTDPLGDTAATMRSAGLQTIAPLNDSAAIEALLGDMLHSIEAGTASRPDPVAARRNARDARAGELASLLQEACSP
jgi:hypothetical protein